MLYLAVETSQQMGSLCLIRDSQILASRDWSRSGSHSEFLTKNIEEIVDENKISFFDLDAIAVGTGPGSFTGIRVAINFARTYGFLTNKKIYALSSLDLLASQLLSLTHPNFEIIHVLQYGFRDILYVASYINKSGKLLCTLEPTAISAPQLSTLNLSRGYVVGTGLEVFSNQILDQKNSPFVTDSRLSNSVHAKFFLNTDVLNSASPCFLSWNQLIPLYIRASEAEEKLRRGL